ncbi:MAG: Sll0314/Alr1548 family TPR repeat-containing protein [Microcoleaceae cyanobacterium]
MPIQTTHATRFAALICASFISSAGFLYAALAANDPFRQEETRPIGQKTTQAFESLFEQGNYPDANWYLEQAESEETNEPMVYAMLAAFSYQKENWSDLKSYADKTLETAQRLADTDDQLRGNLYLAIGHFLQGGHILATEGNLKGAPQALQKLQDVFNHLDKAQEINASDPELNLIKGYMDLLLSLNLPFSSPEAAITTLESGSPSYLVNRGIALAYRDLGKTQQALEFINKAIAETPDNPEVLYLKAQILDSLGRKNKDSVQLTQAKENFSKALQRPEQLPKRLVAQIFYEQCKNLNRIDQQKRPCDPRRDQIKAFQGNWGPTADRMPDL